MPFDLKEEDFAVPPAFELSEDDFKEPLPSPSKVMAPFPGIRPNQYEQNQLMSFAAGRGKGESGMESGTELTTALATGIPRDIARLKSAASDALTAVVDAPPNIYNKLKGLAPGDRGYVAPIGKELLSDASTAATKPFVPIPKFESKPDDSFLIGAGKEAANLLLGIPEFMETPLGAATSGVGLAVKGSGALIRRAFAADMMKSMAEQAPEIYSNWDKMTPGEKGKAITGFLGTGAMAALLTHPEFKGGQSKGEPVQGPPTTGDSFRPTEGAKPIGPVPTAEQLIRMNPDQFSEWKTRINYGPQSHVAIADTLAEADIPKLESLRDQLRKESRDSFDAMLKHVKGYNDADMLSQGKVSLKAQTLNEIIDSYKDKQSKETPPVPVAESGGAVEVAEPPTAPPETKPDTGEPPPPKKPTTTSAPSEISVGPGARSPIDVPIGTQEAQLMDALQKLPEGKEGKDSPRISVADRIADSVASGKGAISKWWLRTKAGAEQYKRLLLGAPRSEDSFWSVKKDWAANRQVNAGVAKEMIEKGKETYPKQLHRQAMGKYAEALMTDNPESTLKAWAAGAKRPANRLQYEAALKLTDEQKQAARQMVQYWEAKGQELHEAGLLNNLIEDYAGQHMVDMQASKPPAELNQLRADLVRGTFNTNFKYALQRLFQTEFDLENAGYKLKTTDIFDKLANYSKTANDVLADRAAIRSWMEGETKDGKPLFATGQLRIPIEGAKNDRLMVNPKVRPDPVWKDPKTGEATSVSGEYVKIEHPAFKKWQWAESTPEGKQIFVQGDVWAHKSIADELKNTFGRSHLYDIPGIDTATRLNAQLKGIKLVGFFHQVKTGSHALFHLTRPWAQPKVNPHDAFTQAAMRAGLQLFEARNQEIFSEGMASSSLLQGISNLPKTLTGIEKLGLGDRLRAYQEYLFQDYIPRIKLATYRNALERNLSRYKDKGLDENQIRQITATQINSAFGEMNWRLLGINPTFQHSLRLALLAPDFQAAQHGFAAQLFTKYGGEQRMAAAIMIASVYTGARVLNQIFDDDPHFELKRAFSVVHGKREYGIRTIATDAQRAVSDTAQYIYHRLSPILSATAEGLTRTSAMGKKETGAESLKQIGYRALPIPVTPRPDIGFIDNAISSTLGVYEKRHSAVSDMLQTAHDWKKANDPAYQAGAVQYPESAYGPIRNALADNDLKSARAEYNKLRQSHSPSKIEQVLSPRAASGHPKPFTSVKHESAFVKSLNDEQRKEYAKAIKEREDIYQRFKAMKSLP